MYIDNIYGTQLSVCKCIYMLYMHVHIDIDVSQSPDAGRGWEDTADAADMRTCNCN